MQNKRKAKLITSDLSLTPCVATNLQCGQGQVRHGTLHVVVIAIASLHWLHMEPRKSAWEGMSLNLPCFPAPAGTGTSFGVYSHQSKHGPEVLCISVHPWGNRCCQKLKYDQKQESTKIDEIMPVSQDTWEVASALYNPRASRAMKGTRALTSAPPGAAAGVFSAGCCLLSSAFKLGLSQIPRPVWLAPSVVSHRGVFLQLTELNLALTLPLLSVPIQGGGVLLQILLACFISPSSLRGQETFIS